ncbi:MAG: hypothetical protein IJK97_14375, partial [Thermoguttaceae bacterium]|nr:hypothetical protein [Thermoguttaceae bacterium]
MMQKAKIPRKILVCSLLKVSSWNPFHFQTEGNRIKKLKNKVKIPIRRILKKGRALGKPP